MNKHHRSSLQLIVVIALTILISVYGFGLEVGYGIIFLFITVGYTVYLNFIAFKKEQKEK